MVNAGKRLLICFSAGASFGAAAVLGAAGIVTIKKTKHPSQLMFASMPVLFALQQVAEGFEWLSFNQPAFEAFRKPMMYTFLIFAQVLWPAWTPLAVRNMETDRTRKRLMDYLTIAGLATSVMLAYRLVYLPVTSDIEGHHIRYSITSPQWIIPVSSALYFIATLISPLLSTLKYMKTLGILMFAALIVTQIFYAYYLISVWCFFAAVLSAIILFVLQHSMLDRSQLHSILKNRINPDKANW